MTTINHFSGSDVAATDVSAQRSSNSSFMPTLKIAKAASLVAYVAVALATGGAVNIATSTDAHAASCGGVNQSACTVFQRPGKPCDAGLKLTKVVGGKCVKRTVSSPKPPKRCGGTNQRSCTVLERPGRPCDSGLELTRTVGGKCIKPKGSLETANAAHINVVKKIAKCMQSPRRLVSFREMIKQRDYRKASRIAVQCLSQRDRNALRSPLSNTGSKETDGIRYNSITFGVATGIQTHYGAGVEAGVVIDLNGKVNARLYTVSEVSDGVGLNIGADIVVGLSQDTLLARKVITTDTAFVIAGKFVKGLGISFNYDGHVRYLKASAYDGFSIAAGVGVGFSALSRHKQITTIF